MHDHWRFTYPLYCFTPQFFAWRVHNLRHQWWLTSLIVFFSTCGLVGATVTTAWHRHLTRFDKLYEIQAPMLVWSSCFVACDLITATALYSTLRRSVTGFGDTDNSITRIKNLILQTSGLTMTIDLIHLIIVGIKVRLSPLEAQLLLGREPITDAPGPLPQPNYLLHFMANAAVSKVYANSLLSTLTTRSPNSTHLLGDDSGVSGPSVRISTSHMGPDSLPRTGDMFPLPALSPHWRSRGINKDTAGTAAGTDGQGLGATRLMGPVVTTVQHRFASTSADKFNMSSGVDSSGPTVVGDRDQEHDFDEEKSAGTGPRGSQLTDLEVVRTHESEPNRCHPPPPPHEA